MVELTELKNLEDIYKFRIKNLDRILLDKTHDVAINKFVDELRQEAIKWIKFLQTTWDFYEGADASNDNLKDWIKDFFNITEEDLQ